MPNTVVESQGPTTQVESHAATVQQVHDRYRAQRRLGHNPATAIGRVRDFYAHHGMGQLLMFGDVDSRTRCAWRYATRLMDAYQDAQARRWTRGAA